jgi:hypothetical protein
MVPHFGSQPKRGHFHILDPFFEPMKQSELFRQNAENCAYLAECAAASQPLQLRCKRKEAA